MLHHRFPNGFTDLIMDETDREVSTLTDRAFRSLCVGDDAVYNDELFFGYSPFSCHKPLVGEPLKKIHHKESKRQGQLKNDKNNAQSWKKQQHKNLSQMSSFLKALSATEESCDGLLIKNGGITDSNGESWDKSALRSIQKELSEFSNYHTSITDEHCKNHHLQHAGDGSSSKTGKDVALPLGKSSKIKNGKSTVKLRKLNIKNFFLHSESSPFQTWTDFKQLPFGQQETTTLPIDNIPNWFDLPFYKELREAHKKHTLHTEEAQQCQKAEVERPPTAPKPIPPPPPPKVLQKSSVTVAEKRCTSDGVDVDGHAAPWRRNRFRAKSAVQVNQPGILSQDNYSETVDESILFVKKDARSVEVKAVEEASSLASTPFSICQLMTPVIPSRQPTETSEILLPSVLDLPLRPHSEAKAIPEPPVKRDSYKSLASSILFNLKDNRKRVKSRYTPPKFKTLELSEDASQSPKSDCLKNAQTGSDGNASGLSTPAILKDGQTHFSPILEPTGTPTIGLTKHDTDRPLSEDYLLSNLLQTKREAAGSSGFGEENSVSSLIHSKKNKSPMAKKQNYPSLNLYKKAIPFDSDMKYLQFPQSTSVPEHINQPTETNEFSPLMLNKEFSPKALPTNTGLSPNALNVNKGHPSLTTPHAIQNERLSSNVSVGKRPPDVLDKSKQLVKHKTEKDFGAQPSYREKYSNGQTMTTMDVIRAAREAINAVKSKALSATPSESIKKPISDSDELIEKETDDVSHSKEMLRNRWEILGSENNNVSTQSENETMTVTVIGENSNVKKDPPPVPKRNFAKSDLHVPLDHQPTHNFDCPIKGDLGDAKVELAEKENESFPKQGKLKYVFPTKQNNYIKHQRYAVGNDEQVDGYVEGDLNVNARNEMDEEIMSVNEIRDRQNLINDFHTLKELERTDLGDHILENAKNKLGVINLDEEARAKNDLISRELCNIKKGMLSMRGNTSAKRELFAKKEKELRKQGAFTKIDSNVVVNKALINDNYDKAKMALEEIISDRQKRKNKVAEPNAIFEENASDESYITRVQQGEEAMKQSLLEGKEKQNGSTFALKETDLRERLDDLRDHKHMRQILAQTEPIIGESHRWGGRVALPGTNERNALLKSKPKHVKELTYSPSYEVEEGNLKNVAKHVSEESIENLEIVGKGLDAPPVPPRNKKGGNKRDGIITKETDSFQETVDDEFFCQDEDGENGEECLEEMSEAGLGKHELDLPEVNPRKEATFENSNAKAQESFKLKRKAPLKPDNLNTPDYNVTKYLVAEHQPDKLNTSHEEVKVSSDAVEEIPRNIISPLLLVNGIHVNQSPPDQASLSSKSSYFSVESALHRNTETEPNIYHSLENLIGEMEEVNEGMQDASQNMKQESDKTEVEYYSLSDHESEPEVLKRPITSPQKEGKESENIPTDQNNERPVSPSNTFSPTLGIPALFKVKDNTFSNMSRRTLQPWTPRASHLEKEVGGLHQERENAELPMAKQTATTSKTIDPSDTVKVHEILLNQSPPLLLSPLNLQKENPKKPQDGLFLTVPQDEDRFSGISPSSEGVESLTTSTTDTADEMGMRAGMLHEHEVPKVPSEHSGSTCSGNESQLGLLKPPAVLPKSEKAVLKAIKLANRRMKKEEAHKVSHSSSKHKADRHVRDKSENKSSTSSRNNKNSEKRQKEKVEDDHHPHNDRNEQLHHQRGGINNENHNRDKTEMSHKTCRQSQKPNNPITQVLPSTAAERQGRSSDRQVRHKLDQRHYSCDRVISDVPVYKAHVGERPMSDRPFNRSQSTDRYLGFKTERKLSADMSVNEKLEPRTQLIEKSIVDETHQRGRARDKASRENPLRRSHSIGAYSTEVPPPTTLSRQSSHTSQFSRQSSIEHAIVTQSFPMTQRKLLQDPDSGQYFFVDMPVQVKTKTFFDPETGSYVQLPVQPPEGALPQALPMEVLTPPMVVYHGFVPVPLSPLARKATIQAPYMELEEFQQRCLERSRQPHSKEGHSYLEPIYRQHEDMLGEFLGTDELDCPS